MAVYKDTDFAVTGSGDETTKLQTAFNTTALNGDTLLVTKQISINDQGILVPDNAKVRFLAGAVLKLLPTSVVDYDLLMFMGNNSTVWNPRVDGSNESNTGSTGTRSGMGIGIAGASNITIYGPEVSNCWGDGIYIRGSYTSANTPPSNIKVFSPRIDGCGRNAVSVVSANGLTVRDIEGRNCTIADPQALIDFEPNVNGDVLQNIKIMGARSIGNTNGLRFSLQNLPGVNPQTVSIDVSEFKDYGSTSRAVYWTGLNKGAYSVSGSISINNPTFVQSASTYSSSSWDNSVTVTVNNATTVA